MRPNKIRTVAWVGTLGGVATIVGVALPWVRDASDRGAGLSVNGLIAGPWVMVFGIVMASASLFLLADVDPRKVVAILAPCSLAVLAYVVPVILKKEAALFGGLAQVFTERGVGLYVCLVGGVLGLVAVAIAASSVLSVAEPGDGETSGGLDLGDVSEPDD
jgi:hypothetical protein